MRARCPNCKSEVVVESVEAAPHFPFCGERCRMADLDRWFTEEYRVSREIHGTAETEDV